MAVDSMSAGDFRMDAGALWRALRSRLLRILVVTALLLAVTFLILMFVPKQYESSAGLLVEDRSNSYTRATTDLSTPSSGITIDALMASQIELIKSRDTLLAVIDSQKLRSVPEFNGGGSSPLGALFGSHSAPKSIDETVLQNLNERLTVIRERDSSVISIYVRSSDPQLAANIANAIAAEHVRRRAGQSVSDTAEATTWLEGQITDLRKKVQDADTKVADYKTQNGIYAGANGTTLPDQQLADVSKQLSDAHIVLSTNQQHAQSIRQLLKSGQSVDGIDDVRNNAVVQSLMQSRVSLQGQLAEKSATLLPAHPTIRALNAQIAQINGQIRAEAGRIASGLDSQVKIQQGVIDSLNDSLATAKSSASTQTQDSVTLDSLTREAKAQHDLLDSYLIRYRDAASRTDAGSVLPDVRIITQAAPAAVPASPKTGLILGAVAFLALALQIGSTLFGELMSGRAVYDRSQRGFVDEVETEEMVPVAPVVAVAPDEMLVATAPATVHDVAPVAAVPAVTEDLSEVPLASEADLTSEALEPSTPQTPAAPLLAEVPSAETMQSLEADITLGRARIVVLAALTKAADATAMGDLLVLDTLTKGLSVCLVDAGSNRLSAELGLTDLCAEKASFGDVVHKVRDNLAEVPWGQLPTLERRSMRAATLVEALADIYEVVIVSCGQIGLRSTLPVFGGLGARLVLVSGHGSDERLADEAVADAAALGFDRVQVLAAPEPQSQVA